METTLLPHPPHIPEVQIHPDKGWVRTGGGSDTLVRRFSVGTRKISLYPDWVSWTDGGSKTHRIFLPFFNKAFVTYYRPDHSPENIDYLDVSIGPTVIEGNKLWFGLEFYEGEGSEGVGGIGFIDLETAQLGLLRHPALFDCSIAELEVDDKNFTALTVANNELSNGACDGLVLIDRSALTSVVYPPPKGLSRIWDKDGELTEIEVRESERYKSSTQGLVRRFSDWPKKGGPKMTVRQAEIPLSLKSLSQIMIAQAEFERDWFDRAVEHGKAFYHQRCKLVAGESRVNCDYPMDVEAVRKQKSYRHSDARENYQHWVVELLDRNMTSFKCSPPGWQRFYLWRVFHVVPYGQAAFTIWHEDDVAQYFHVNEADDSTAGVQIRLAFPKGETWLWRLENLRLANITCEDVFSKYSGSAITEVTASIRAQTVDHSFLPVRLRRLH